MPPQLKRFQGSGRNSALNPPLDAEGAGEAHLLEAIDNIGDFLRFVDGTNRSEVSSREFARVEFMNRRSAGPRAACVPARGARRFLGRPLTLIFRLAAKTEGD
jgi:hypothetical protein